MTTFKLDTVAAALNGQPPTLADVHAAFGRWLAFPQDDGRPRYDLIDVALATVIANRMASDPLWVFIVGPPSSGKTEIIRALSDVPDVYLLSSLTAQTFASGFEKKGVEASLLPRLTGKVLVMKDFTTVLTMYREKRAEIIAQLREIYDGSFTKEWGNGKTLNWTGKVGLLAGVTPILDREYAMNAVLGERFLLYRVPGAPARILAGRALRQQAGEEVEQRKELRRIVLDYLERLPTTPPPIPEPMIDGLAALAEFVALARSPVIFDYRGVIEYIPTPEAPGRLAKQLALFARALAVVRQQPAVDLAAFSTVLQVAHDTMPAQRQIMLQTLLAKPDSTTTEIAETTGYPTETTRRYLQELVAVKLATREAQGPGLPDRWAPSTGLTALIGDIRRPFTTEGSSVV